MLLLLLLLLYGSRARRYDLLSRVRSHLCGLVEGLVTRRTEVRCTLLASQAALRLLTHTAHRADCWH